MKAAGKAEAFRYGGFELDPATDSVHCRYRLAGGELDGVEFTESVRFPGGGDWSAPVVAEMARLVHLLAGVSYYKAAAPPVVDLGDTPLTELERDFLRDFYLHGLGEYAYRNSLDLSGLRFEAAPLTRGVVTPSVVDPGRPLIPFGGGVDSIVTVELTRENNPDAALFVVNRPGDRFAAIERPAAVTGLPVVRAERSMDPQILRSSALGFLNGHVPVTGVISAIALLAAALDGRDCVIMSNEWSASSATLLVGGVGINHQYSKGAAFENGLRAVVHEAAGAAPQYFSLLRPFTELWIAQRFARLPQYADTFRSCNRAFLIDPARRATRWCGECDKCCFIDLILAPFLDKAVLERIFDGDEPLSNPARLGVFERLLAITPGAKPWECVGDESECRVAARLAARRPDRRHDPLIARLVAAAEHLTDPDPEALLRPVGPHVVPERYAPAALTH